MQNTTLSRSNLSDAIVVRIREMIMDGGLEPGERVNEVQLAERLGVSRTPLREALARLAAEGALNAIPRLGVFVCPLSVEEFEQIYPMRAILDPAALALAGVPQSDTIQRLKLLNAKIKLETDPERILALDDLFHRELLCSCPNQILLALIDQFTRRTRRYELALLRERANIDRAASDHRKIIAALVRRDLSGACEALRANMLSGKEPILAWLKSRGGE